MKRILNFTLMILILASALVIAEKQLGTHKIDPETCTACAVCVEVCPEGSISEGEVDGKTVYIIDPETCTDCGVCVEECPEGSISAGDGK